MRKVLGIILSTVGLAILAGAVYLLLQSGDISVSLLFGSLAISGIAFMLGGWAVMTGENIREILHTVWMSLR